MNNYFTFYLKNPFLLFRKILSKIYIFCVLHRKNIQIKGKLYINGIPLIDIRNGARIEIGDKVILHSLNKGYHLNMHSSVKLFAEGDQTVLKIGNNTNISGSCIHAYKYVSIGNNCLIAANCQIMEGSGHDLSFPDVEDRIHTNGLKNVKPIIIEDNVWICANSIVLPGVRIGYGSVITPNSVVAKDVPPMVVAGGNPAIVIRDYSGT
ncbi:MAG: putative acetyltransferase [Syntrophus sp. PtaB.Bin138]|nr:MAG: putative acetyltransferase [Syntrophus sp. PtaB.Bin138]